MFKLLADGSLSDTAVSFSMDVLERERLRGKTDWQIGSGGGAMGASNSGQPGGMGQKSSSTSQLSAAGKMI